MCGCEECEELAVWCVVGMLVGMVCCVMGECRAMVVECVWGVWHSLCLCSGVRGVVWACVRVSV